MCVCSWQAGKLRPKGAITEDQIIGWVKRCCAVLHSMSMDIFRPASPNRPRRSATLEVVSMLSWQAGNLCQALCVSMY
jgi:hypothetical protein